MAERDFPHASLVEGVRFTAQVALPNVVQGLFRRRRTMAAAAGAARVERFGVSFVAGLKRSYGDGPLWIRVAQDEALLLLGRDAIRKGLEGSPDPFASDPEPKRGGMAHFQPHALTISRNPEWEDRRRFTEAVLDTSEPEHRLAARFREVAGEEAATLPEEVDWDGFNEAVRRAARRVILGDEAGDDAELSQMLGELMDKSNPPGRGDDDLLARYTRRLEEHVGGKREGSLASLFDDAPVSEQTDPVGQVTHWLFALGDTLAINAFRCLALLATHAAARERARAENRYLGACLHEAMRLWPTTPMLSRETIRDTDWDGVTVPEGTQLLIVNTFNHRDREDVQDADRLMPERWLEGDAESDWQFNHFSHGPQGCPGVALSLLVGTAMLQRVLREHDLELQGTTLDPEQPLPHTLDFFSLRLQLQPRAAG
jgi:cytochrome P450